MSQTADDPTPAPGHPAGPRRATPRRYVLRRVVVGVSALLVVALVGVGAYAWTINRQITSNIHRGIELPAAPTTPGAASPTAQQPRETGVLNYVLLGSDSRDGNPSDGRSDTIMVVHLNKARNQAYITSFPRDMYVDIPGYGRNKINAAFSEGGPTLTVKTLEQLTGASMDHVVLVDFEGFIDLTTDLGGVTVPNKTAFTSHGYTYPKGKVTIAGKKALWFVRERHSLPGGDLDRAENQRNVIKAIVAKGLSAGVISDPAQFTAFIGNLSKHLTVDNSLSDSEIRSTALSLRLSAKDITLLQAPISGFASIGGQDVDIVDQVKMAELGKAMRDDTMASYVDKNPQE
ncbi:LCP family protein [Microlunatus flavus]|uniref:Cell envelope-related function transcriptional attenuator common domain-containing protein n=1 Tax=Microlunatus flavus TaxID=1036181 RepID=A0A1H9B6E8_9ACTN|nr:LCP family protein [Microlunatus flavus]SEP84409.1 cell envelope-related function transcriptional attenuator common domain-containing protein [Microlunatus flavus]